MGFSKSLGWSGVWQRVTQVWRVVSAEIRVVKVYSLTQALLQILCITLIPFFAVLRDTFFLEAEKFWDEISFPGKGYKQWVDAG